MITLFLDLASNSGSVALCRDGAVHMQQIHHRIGDHEVLPIVKKLLEASKVKYEDLTQLACVLGPGGFTSLRSAVAFINALSFSLNIPSAGIHLSDLYRARSNDADAVWLHSTRKTALFIRQPNDAEASLIEFTSLSQHLTGKQAWMGELIPEQRALVDSLGMKEAPLQSLEEALPFILADLTYEKKTLEPWYGRGF
jgi:tRNA threonylcarbamoyl adenosine modification protein YeaZ